MVETLRLAWHETWDITEEQSAALNVVADKYVKTPGAYHNNVVGVIADVLIALEHPEIWLRD